MNKKIITIAEIVFALVFVVLLAVFMATINSKGNQANSQLVDTLNSNSMTSISSYTQMADSGQSVKGTVVINACNNYSMIGQDNRLQIKVFTGKTNQVEKNYGFATEGNITQANSGSNKAVDFGDEIGGYTEPNSNAKHYINPSGNFEVEMVQNANEVYTGIIFTQIED